MTIGEGLWLFSGGVIGVVATCAVPCAVIGIGRLLRPRNGTVDPLPGSAAAWPTLSTANAPHASSLQNTPDGPPSLRRLES